MLQNYEIFPNLQPKSLIFIKKPLVFGGKCVILHVKIDKDEQKQHHSPLYGSPFCGLCIGV